MPLTKANNIVIDLESVSEALANDTSSGSIREYIDTENSDQSLALTSSINGKANSVHTHSISNVNDLEATLNSLRLNTKSFKNKMINGCLRVAQRGGFASQTIQTITSSMKYGPIDRFALSSVNFTNSTVSQAYTLDSVGISASHNFMKVTPYTSTTTNSVIRVIHRIASENTVGISVSSGTTACTFSVSINNYFGSSFSVQSRVKTPYDATPSTFDTSLLNNFTNLVLIQESSTQTISNSATKTKHVFSLEVPKAYAGLQIEFDLIFPSIVNNSDISKYIALSEFQFELGTTNSELEIIPFEEVYEQCLSYYERIGYNSTGDNLVNTGFVSVAVTNASVPISYSRKRKIPTINLVGSNNDFSVFNDPARKPVINTITFELNSLDKSVLTLSCVSQIAIASGLGHPVFFTQKSNINSYIEVDAEI